VCENNDRAHAWRGWRIRPYADRKDQMDKGLTDEFMRIILARAVYNTIREDNYASNVEDIITSLCLCLAKVITANLEATKKMESDNVAGECKRVYDRLIYLSFQIYKEKDK
jgi:hypothetical protein